MEYYLVVVILVIQLHFAQSLSSYGKCESMLLPSFIAGVRSASSVNRGTHCFN